MNSNRKRNLKKLARNIITTTAMASSLNSAGTNATEAQSSQGISKSAIMTSAALLAGCAGIAGLNYYSDRKKTDADDKHRERMYQLKKAEADMRLKLVETKKLLEKHGLNDQQITALANGINQLRRRNRCQSFITTDDIIEALETGGPTTIRTLKAMAARPTVNAVSIFLMMAVANKLNANDEQLGKMETALKTLIKNTNSYEEVCNSLLEVQSIVAPNNLYDRWDQFAPNGDPTVHLGLNAHNDDIDLAPSNEFAFRQINYDAGAQLLPDALKPLFGDTLWCGVACGRPSRDPNSVGALEINVAMGRCGPEQLLGALANEQAKKTMQTGEMPMYLVLSTNPAQRDANNFLAQPARMLVPLFENSRDNRGGKEKPDLRKLVGKWLVANAKERLKSDRVDTGNNDYE